MPTVFKKRDRLTAERLEVRAEQEAALDQALAEYAAWEKQEPVIAEKSAPRVTLRFAARSWTPPAGF
jgi:hypothetical protein